MWQGALGLKPGHGQGCHSGHQNVCSRSQSSAPFVCPGGGGAERRCPAQGLPGALLQLMKVTRSSRGAAGQNWPLPSQTPPPGTHLRPCKRDSLPPGGGVTPREAMGVPAGGHRGAWEARGGARGLWKGYQETRSCSGLEAARKQSHAVTGHLGSSYEVMGRAKAPAGGGSATPVRQERGSAPPRVLASSRHTDDGVILFPSCSLTGPERPCPMLVSGKLCAEKGWGLCSLGWCQAPWISSLRSHVTQALCPPISPAV